MTHTNSRNLSGKLQRRTGLILLVVVIISLPFVIYYFGNFYRSSWQDYKNWYPKFFFIVFPVTRLAPFLVLGLLAFLLRDWIFAFFRALFLIPSVLLNISACAKAAIKKYAGRVLILLVTLAAALSISEYFLQKQGFKPGYRLYSIYFRPVDSLFSIEGFYADSNGIFCVSQEARAFIASELKTKNSPLELTPYKENQSPEIYSLSEDFIELRDSSYRSEFKSFIERIDMEDDTAEREFFAAVKQYVMCPINSNGFKSIEFKKYNSKRKSILLLGDSFTWGHSTSNKTNSFADLLLARGYIVYNAGISGADPAQYLQLSKILIPLLGPDFVVVNFFMGNDIQYFNREPEPYMPVFFSTNAGNLISCPEGIYHRSPEVAYDYTLSVYTIPVENSIFNRFCSTTAFGTLVWRALAKIGLADVTVPRFMDYTRQIRQVATDKPYADVQLKHIREITQRHSGKFLLIAIPELKGRRFVFPDDIEGLFEGIQYFTPSVKIEDFSTYDGHFNDLGSAMYAEFIDSLLRKN